MSTDMLSEPNDSDAFSLTEGSMSPREEVLVLDTEKKAMSREERYDSGLRAGAISQTARCLLGMIRCCTLPIHTDPFSVRSLPSGRPIV